MANIVVDFRDTLNKVKEIEQLSVDVLKIANNNIDEISESIPSVWSGDAAKRYQKKISKINKKIKKRANALEKNAVGLKASVNRLKRAEEYAQRLFSKK
ncbi:MAG: WXG100 family type VII secretion target [Lachnospiraceae bacterium]|nr:WXG100 family type VII secretion target [Lachnospiraceae bacterium]